METNATFDFFLKWKPVRICQIFFAKNKINVFYDSCNVSYIFVLKINVFGK